MGFEIDGLDDLQKDLKELQRNAERLDGTNNVPLNELFTPRFMQKYTETDSIEAFFDQSPWSVTSQDDLEAISEVEFNEYVNERTMFETEEQMMAKAGEEWIAQQMGF